MSSVLVLEKLSRTSKYQHPFLQELVEQIRLADTFSKYTNWTDELLLKQLIISIDKEEHSHKNFNLDPLYQVLINAFYNAIAVSIERKTGHKTDAFIHLKNKEFSSAVISCGGVLVLYSLMWGYHNFGFSSLQELVISAENNINRAITKASNYLDF